MLNRSASTISRELSRSTGRRGCRPRQAQSLADGHRAINDSWIDDVAWQFAQDRFQEQWSPVQISNQATISVVMAYQRVYANKKAGGALWKQLRCQKQRKKRYGKTVRCGIIPNRQSIASLVEHKTAQAVSDAMTKLLTTHRDVAHTITSDNGQKFAGEATSKQLQADFYFPHPYASWERGTNKNTNGLIQQYFQKSRNFTTITQQGIDTAEQPTEKTTWIPDTRSSILQVRRCTSNLNLRNIECCAN